MNINTLTGTKGTLRTPKAKASGSPMIGNQQKSATQLPRRATMECQRSAFDRSIRKRFSSRSCGIQRPMA
ncbi:MAG: hypothetical protein R2818_00185 [Flavobacteriales bacterium]